jgi:RNA polymerase sigma factor (sigma-70 family)
VNLPPDPPAQSAASDSDPSNPTDELSTTHLFRKYAASQDPVALAALVKRIEPMLFAQASRRIAGHLKARFDPEDVAQSVLMIFVKKVEAGQIVWQGSPQLRSLLCKMICQKVREHVRKHTAEMRDASKEVSLQGPAAPHIEPPVSDEELEVFAQEELQQQIGKLIEHFKGKARQLQVLPRIIAGEDKAQIAADLGITKKRVQQISDEAEEFVRKKLMEP